MSESGYARSKRFAEQRWLLDAAIRLIGVDWDQGRSRYLALPCGPAAEPDFARIRERVKKFSDIHREFAAGARAREAAADDAARAGDSAALRQHAFTAAVMWGGAQWPLFGNTPLNLAYGEHKVACYRALHRAWRRTRSSESRSHSVTRRSRPICTCRPRPGRPWRASCRSAAWTASRNTSSPWTAIHSLPPVSRG